MKLELREITPHLKELHTDKGMWAEKALTI